MTDITTVAPHGGFTSLVEFLTARLAEDETIALTASRGSWSNGIYTPLADEWEASVSAHGDEELLVALRPGLPRPPQIMDGGWGQAIHARADYRDADDISVALVLTHAARHDPARVLAEVAAKRKLLGAHRADKKGHCKTCARWTTDMTDDGYKLDHVAYEGVEAPCLTRRLLALPWADHPDYDESWRMP